MDKEKRDFLFAVIIAVLIFTAILFYPMYVAMVSVLVFLFLPFYICYRREEIRKNYAIKHESKFQIKDYAKRLCDLAFALDDYDPKYDEGLMLVNRIREDMREIADDLRDLNWALGHTGEFYQAIKEYEKDVRRGIKTPRFDTIDLP